MNVGNSLKFLEENSFVHTGAVVRKSNSPNSPFIYPYTGVFTCG